MDPDRQKPSNRLPMSTDAGAASLRPTCVVGDTLCEVQVLSEAEWETLPPEARPSPAEYVAGLGWVVATPRGSAGSSKPPRRAL